MTNNNKGPQIIRETDYESEIVFEENFAKNYLESNYYSVDSELLDIKQCVYYAPEHSVVDASADGVLLQIGSVRLPAAELFKAAFSDNKLVVGDVLSQLEKSENLPSISETLMLPELALPDFDDEVAITALGNRLQPNCERQIFGYDRNAGDVILPSFGQEVVKIPVINEFLTLPQIVDPVLHRVFFENEKRGPRLIAISPHNLPQAARLVVAEFPPTRVTALTRQNRHEIYTPYTIVALSPTHGVMYLFCRTSPMTEEDDVVYHFPFPHIATGGSVCTGFIPRMKELRDMEPLEAATYMMNYYYESGYNYHLSEVGLDILPKEIGDKAGYGHGYEDEDNSDAFLLAWSNCTYEEIIAFKYEKVSSIKTVTNQLMQGGMGARKHEMNWFLNETKIAAMDNQAQNSVLDAAMLIEEYQQKLETI